MPFKIGEVVSPAVAAALIRRGESANQGGFIKRDPTVREEKYDDSGNVQAQIALLREERMREQAANKEAREGRSENFDREQFDFQKGESGAQRREREEKGTRDNRNLDLQEAKALQDRRQEAARILQQIAAITQRARKPNPDTGQPDPSAVQESQTIARALLQQMMNLDLPEADKEAIRAQLRQIIPTLPPSRAPGNVSRGGNPAQSGAGVVDSTTANELQLPTRTP
jgi:hypothetical protein